MKIILIGFGLIIVISFVVGMILMASEEKKLDVNKLTDDPKILFDEEVKKDTSSEIIEDLTTNTSVDTLDEEEII